MRAVRVESKVLETKEQFRKKEYFSEKKADKIPQYSLCDRYSEVKNQWFFITLCI